MPNSIPLSAAVLVVSLLGPAPCAQQKVELKVVVPESYERATRIDEQGLVQWDKHGEERCPTCAGTTTTTCIACARLEGHEKCLECGMKKTAPCRACGGLGHFPDPLQQVLCPGCLGAGMIPCDVCGGFGGSKVEGGGDKRKDCVGCKGDGGYRCSVCNGARLVEAPALKPSVGEAPLAALVKARDGVDGVLKSVAAFAPGKSARKSVKEYGKLLQPAAAALPPLKRCQKAFDELMDRTFKGELWVGHEEREANAIQRFRSNNEYYLKHQKRLLELCIARAERNAKTLADSKQGK